MQHLCLDYCEQFELAWKKKIDKLKWNMSSSLKKKNLNILVNIGNNLVVAIVSVQMQYHNLKLRFLDRKRKKNIDKLKWNMSSSF